MLAMFWFVFKINIFKIEPFTQFKSKKIKKLYISQQALQLVQYENCMTAKYNKFILKLSSHTIIV